MKKTHSFLILLLSIIAITSGCSSDVYVNLDEIEKEYSFYVIGNSGPNIYRVQYGTTMSPTSFERIEVKDTIATQQIFRTPTLKTKDKYAFIKVQQIEPRETETNIKFYIEGYIDNARYSHEILGEKEVSFYMLLK